MKIDYGFGNLENCLVEVFHSDSPDMNEAKKIIDSGVDVNTLNDYRDENLLSESLRAYDSFYFSIRSEPYESSSLENKANVMCEIIDFFVSHGFDINGFGGCLGAQCLYALSFMTYDRYMIKVTKHLFDIGAKNRTISDRADEDETPWGHVEDERDYLDSCEGEHSLGNLYEALYRIYEAADNGDSYDYIDSYECAVGKKIIKVLASPNNDKPSIFYSMDLPTFKKENCFTSDLYFVYDIGALRTTQFADFWVDATPDESELVDVSECFPSIVGSEIKSFSFNNRAVHKESTTYTQPITKIEMESVECIRFSINFGDVEDKDRAAFFELI